MHRLLIVLLSLSACSVNAPVKPGNDPHEPGEPPWPSAWAEANAGLPAGFEPVDLESAQGSAWLYLKTPDGAGTGLWRWDAASATWTRAAGPASQYGIGGLSVGPDGQLYASRSRELYRFESGAWKRLADAPDGIESVLVNAAFDAAKLYAIHGPDHAPRLSAYDPVTDAWRIVRAGANQIPSAGPSGALLTRDGALYVSRKWAIRDTKGQTGAVFKLAADGASWEDVTFNLRDVNDKGLPIHLLNATGSGWGPFNGIVLAPDGAAFFGATEQGVFRFVPEESRWLPHEAIWYGAHMATFGGYFHTGKETLVRWLDSTRHQRIDPGGAGGTWGGAVRDPISPDAGRTVFARRELTVGEGDGKKTVRSIIVLRVPEDSPVADRNLDLEQAFYLGHAGDDRARSIAFAPDGLSLYLGWNLDGAGRVTRFALAGDSLGEVAFGNELSELVVAPDGEVIVAGAFGVAWLSADLATERFRDASQPVKRLARAEDGTLATLSNKTVQVRTKEGTLRTTFEVGRAFVEDVAISSSTGLVYVVGFDNQRNAGVPVQVAVLEARRLSDSAFAWKTWGFDPAKLAADMADTRLYRVAMGADGLLYVLGEVAGGNSIFRWNGRDLSTSTLVTFDPYNEATNTKSEHKGYFARLDPATGAVERGQLVITRLSNGAGNTFRTADGELAADAKGRVFIAGHAAYRSAGRDLNTMEGKTVGPYHGGDASLLVVSPDFRARLRWTPFSRDAARGGLHSIALHGSRVGVAGSSWVGRLATTHGPDAPNAGNAPDATNPPRDAWVAHWNE